MQLAADELARYAQQIKLKLIGVEGQLALKNARVLCVGAGGLASPLLLYLAAAGVGTLGIVDDDAIELSNLQRQILYSTENIGSKKAIVSQAKLLQLNSKIQINIHAECLSLLNARELIANYDIIADCSDNFATRYLVNKICLQEMKPFVFASIHEFSGQCATFIPHQGPCFCCVFPKAPAPELVPDCNQAGVLGVLPGLLGVVQATEVLKYILNIGELLTGRLLSIDALSMQFKEFKFNKNDQCHLCVLKHTEELNLITPAALHHKLVENNQVVLLDVRTFAERQEYHIGGVWIPLIELPQRITELNHDAEIIVYCRSGQRSLTAVNMLKEANFVSVQSLEGGLIAWQNQSF